MKRCYDCGKITCRKSGQCYRCYNQEINNTPEFQAKLAATEKFLKERM